MAQKNDCICMVIGWPETWSKGAEKFFGWCHDVGIIKDRYFKVGHASMCLIHKEHKTIEYFDFGRYTCDAGMGRARGKNTDPSLVINLKADIGSDGKVKNIQEIVDYLFDIVHYTHGEGVIYFSMYDKMNYKKSMKFVDDIQQQGSVRYTTFAPGSTNCSRFVCGTLMAGTSSLWDRIKLFLTPTFRASPVGTAVDVGYQSKVYRQVDKDSPLENFKMGRWGNLKLLWNNTKGNFVGEKIIRPNLINAVERPENVPEKAQWLGGLGEGNWIYIRNESLGTSSVTRATSYYYNGEVNYDTIVQVKEGESFDKEKAFEVVYDCSRLFVTVKQNGKKLRLYLVDDYQNLKENKINKTASTWT